LSNEVAHRWQLADLVKLFAGSLKGFTHRSRYLRLKYAMF
jgi:hypothetical protein